MACWLCMVLLMRHLPQMPLSLPCPCEHVHGHVHNVCRFKVQPTAGDVLIVSSPLLTAT